MNPYYVPSALGQVIYLKSELRNYLSSESYAVYSASARLSQPEVADTWIDRHTHRHTHAHTHTHTSARSIIAPPLSSLMVEI